jgi:hypothetical protein
MGVCCAGDSLFWESAHNWNSCSLVIYAWKFGARIPYSSSMPQRLIAVILLQNTLLFTDILSFYFVGVMCATALG